MWLFFKKGHFNPKLAQNCQKTSQKYCFLFKMKQKKKKNFLNEKKRPMSVFFSSRNTLYYARFSSAEVLSIKT
jgi:hypothetical protein